MTETSGNCRPSPFSASPCVFVWVRPASEADGLGLDADGEVTPSRFDKVASMAIKPSVCRCSCAPNRCCIECPRLAAASLRQDYVDRDPVAYPGRPKERGSGLVDMNDDGGDHRDRRPGTDMGLWTERSLSDCSAARARRPRLTGCGAFSRISHVQMVDDLAARISDVKKQE